MAGFLFVFVLCIPRLLASHSKQRRECLWKVKLSPTETQQATSGTTPRPRQAMIPSWNGEGDGNTQWEKKRVENYQENNKLSTYMLAMASTQDAEAGGLPQVQAYLVSSKLAYTTE